VSFGPTGLLVPTTAELRQSIREELRVALGAEIQTGPDTVFGQFIDVFAGYLGRAYERQQQTYDSFRPQAAEGVNLESLAAITGTIREAARATAAILTATGTPGTIIPAGFQARVDGGATFEAPNAATIGAGGTVDFEVEATETGPIEAIAGSIDVIVTPVAGLASVTNAADATRGRNAETDFELRARRASGQQSEGEATVPAILAAVLALPIVDQCLVINNRTDTADPVTGLPPHSVRVIVYPDPGVYPADSTIFETIFDKISAGIRSDGDRGALVNDSQTKPQEVRYSVATELALFVTVNVTTDPDYPADGDDQITEAVLAYVNGVDLAGDPDERFGGGLSVGATFFNFRCACAVAEVSGLVTVEVLARVGAPPLPGEDGNIAPDFDEILRTSIPTILVNS